MTKRPEKLFFKVKPDATGVFLQLRFAVYALILITLLYPDVQNVVVGVLRSFIPLSQEIINGIKYGPAAIVFLCALYLYILEISREYILTSERLVIRYGIFLRVEDEVELYRVVDVTQGVNLLQRLVSVGNLRVISTDRTGTVVMPAIKKTSQVRNAIRVVAEKCKSTKGALRVLE